CHIRVIDTFGTEPAYNHEEYATLHGYRTNWGYWNLNARQYMTMFPHTPDNSFMGFVSEELNETEKRSIQQNKVKNMAVVYGKEASMWKLNRHHNCDVTGGGKLYKGSQNALTLLLLLELIPVTHNGGTSLVGFSLHTPSLANLMRSLTELEILL
ncbi:hypothetical protein AMECASPLE_030661, partial [Ameca splendens]